jgi:hypothetical protein
MSTNININVRPITLMRERLVGYVAQMMKISNCL